MAVYWTDKTVTKPCFPEVNNLGNYISRSRIWGIHDALERAEKEISDIYNLQFEEIKRLHKIIADMQGKDITDKLAKAGKQGNVRSYPMNGRKPHALDKIQIEKVLRMYNDDISLSAIARQFGVSYKTIYRIIIALKECNTNQTGE